MSIEAAVPHLTAHNYELLVKAVVDYAIYMIDLEGRVISWNAGAERIKGYTADEVIGSHFSCFFTEADRQAGKPQRALETALKKGRFQDEGWRQRKDGSQFWALTALDVVYNENREVIGLAKITRDMTDKKLAQQRLAEVREQLFQSQKMEALGQLTGGMAHDFNNLLTIILGAADLGRRITQDERLKRQLEIISNAAQRGTNITRQLLNFARKQPLETQVLDLNQALACSLPLLGQSLHGNVQLISELAENLPRIEVNPSQLELALLNLVLNARDAMVNGGAIRVRAYRTELDDETQQLHGEFAAISVTDSGNGMSPEVRSRIFEPFFTTKGYGHGSGLGLSQVYGFVKQSRGGIKVDSEPGQGTTVTLYLPALQAPAAPNANEPRKRILVVEDDMCLSQVAGEIISDMGYDVVVANSAAQALALLQQDACFDLLFSDMLMPGGMNGLELARQARTRKPELAVLLTTGYGDTLHENGIRYPVLLKPYTYEDLANALDNLLQPAD